MTWNIHWGLEEIYLDVTSSFGFSWDYLEEWLHDLILSSKLLLWDGNSESIYVMKINRWLHSQLDTSIRSLQHQGYEKKSHTKFLSTKYCQCWTKNTKLTAHIKSLALWIGKQDHYICFHCFTYFTALYYYLFHWNYISTKLGNNNNVIKENICIFSWLKQDINGRQWKRTIVL